MCQTCTLRLGKDAPQRLAVVRCNVYKRYAQVVSGLGAFGHIANPHNLAAALDEIAIGQCHGEIEAFADVDLLVGKHPNPAEADINAQTLVYMKVKPYAWNEIQAERFARRGIKAAQPGSGQDKWFYPLLACVYAAQYQEVKYLLDVIAGDPRGRPLTDEELLEIKSRYVMYSSRCKFIARSMGPRFVYQAVGNRNCAGLSWIGK